MDLGAYFQTLQYVLMTSTFIALVLVFLYMFHERKTKQARKPRIRPSNSSAHNEQQHKYYDSKNYAYSN